MSPCDSIQERLAEEGAALLQQDADLRRHEEGCAECKAFLEALTQIKSDLQRVPVHDAPGALVANTLHAVRRAADKQRGSEWDGPQRRRLAGALAASVVIAAVLGLTHDLRLPSVNELELSFTAYRTSPDAVMAPGPADDANGRMVVRTADKPTSTYEVSEVSKQGLEGAGEAGQVVATGQLAQQKQDTDEFRAQREVEKGRASARAFANSQSRQEADEQVRKEAELVARLRDELNGLERDARIDRSSRGSSAENKRGGDVGQPSVSTSLDHHTKTKTEGEDRERVGKKGERREYFAFKSMEKSNEEAPADLGGTSTGPVPHASPTAENALARGLRVSPPKGPGWADESKAKAEEPASDAKNRLEEGQAKDLAYGRIGGQPKSDPNAPAETAASTSRTLPSQSSVGRRLWIWRWATAEPVADCRSGERARPS